MGADDLKKKLETFEQALPRELKLRVLSATILIPIVLMLAIADGIAFTGLVLLAAIVMSFEWKTMADKLIKKKLKKEKVRSASLKSSNIFLGTIFYLVKKFSKIDNWILYGVVYIFVPGISLIWLRTTGLGENEQASHIVIIWLFFVVWSSDIAAYFIGKEIGGTKLAPKISPKKTWAGFIGAMSAAGIIGILSAILLSPGSSIALIIISVLFGAIAQGGDLLASYIKRNFDVKNSGNIIPGHGGFIDRADSLILTSPVAAFMILLTNGEGIFL